MKPRTLWGCQPVSSMMAPREAPEEAFSSATMRSALVMGAGGFPRGSSSWIFAQIRRTAVRRSVNLATLLTFGSWFQISTKRLAGHFAASLPNSLSLEKLYVAVP